MTARAVEINHIFCLKIFSITSSNKNPNKAPGMVAITKYQNILLLKESFPLAILSIAPVNSDHQSLKNMARTAKRVPKCKATSKASDDCSHPNK